MRTYTDPDTILTEQPAIHCVARAVNLCPECNHRMWWLGQTYPFGQFACPTCDAHLFPRPAEAAPEVVPDILATIDAAALRERMSQHFETQNTYGLPAAAPDSNRLSAPVSGWGDAPSVSRSWASVAAQLNVSPAGMVVRMAALFALCLPVAYLFVLAGYR